MDLFGEGEILIENNDVLKPDSQYKPSELPERTEEFNQLGLVLKPIRSGDTPNNALVYGPTGQGKTAAVEIKIDQLRTWADEHDRNVHPVHVRCKGCESSYHVLTQLVKKLREVQHGPGVEKPQGHQKKTLVEMIFDEIDAIGGIVLLFLDEIDGIGEDDYALYELTRPDVDNAKIGIIGITNDSQFRRNLDADVRSSLGNREIFFTPYGPDQLQNILARRAARALTDTGFAGDAETYDALESDVLESGVIPKVAAVSAQESGDAREAIRLLQRSCEEAETDGGLVTEAHVEAAKRKIEQEADRQLIISETTQRKIALASVIKEDLTGNRRAGTTDLYQTYCTFCEEIDVRILSQRTFRGKLNDLTHSNILLRDRRGRGRGKGMSNFYALAVDRKLAIDSIGEDSRTVYLADLLQELAT